MKKTPTIFIRDANDRKHLLPEPNPECDWVFKGEGVATRKYDGTCCLMKHGALYKRREIKKGKPIPEDFILADRDEVTGKTVGWVPVTAGPDDRWHLEAFRPSLSNGTYELVGPKIQGNPEGLGDHVLLSHEDAEQYPDAPRTFTELAEWLSYQDIEGLVFHHEDGRMAKIKKRDFGLKRKVTT